MEHLKNTIENIEKHSMSWTELRAMYHSAVQKGAKPVYIPYASLMVRMQNGTVFNAGHNSVHTILRLEHPEAHKAVLHWCLIQKQSDRIVFYEPLGLTTHELSMYLGDHRLVNWLELMRADTSRHRHQAQVNMMNTCAAHCAVRSILGFGESNDIYNKGISKFGMDKDRLVTLLTLMANYPTNLSRISADPQKQTKTLGPDINLYQNTDNSINL